MTRFGFACLRLCVRIDSSIQNKLFARGRLFAMPEKKSISWEFPRWLVQLVEMVAAIFTAIGVVFTLWQWHVAQQEITQAAIVSQASSITAWLSDTETVTIRNASQLTAYEVVAAVVPAGTQKVTADKVAELSYQPVVGPGESTTEVDSGYKSMHTQWVASIAFRDSNGRTWLRNGDGSLKQIRQSPLGYFRLACDAPTGGIDPNIRNDGMKPCKGVHY